MAVETADDAFVNYKHEIYGVPRVFVDDTVVSFAVDGDHGGEPYQPVCWAAPCGPDDYTPSLEVSNRRVQSCMVQGVRSGASMLQLLRVSSIEPHLVADQAHWADVGGVVFTESPFVTVTEFHVTASDDLIPEVASSRPSRLCHSEHHPTTPQ